MLSNSRLAIVISNTSIKDNVATSVVYIHTYNNPIRKTIYYAINITSIEAELFVIRCGINQPTQILDIFHIIIIIDAIQVVQKSLTCQSILPTSIDCHFKGVEAVL